MESFLEICLSLNVSLDLSSTQTLKHVEDKHSVPFTELFANSAFDFYSFIKLVNYFRKHVSYYNCIVV